MLSGNEVIGLFGELIVLEHLLNTHSKELFDNWVGPMGNRHDFEFPMNSLEVKTTANIANNEIQVNGLSQIGRAHV